MNSLKKLNAQEILAIVKKNYDIESFAYGQWEDLKSPDKIDLAEAETEGKKLQAVKDAFYEKYKEELSSVPWSERTKNPLYLEYQSLPSNYEHIQHVILNNLGLGRVEEVAQKGGEGEGDTWYSIKHFKDHDIYIQTNGFYQSYNGTEFVYGYGDEVKPVQVEVTQYHAVK